ncbi:MgtC/SapB family protein [Microvirga brassicacearum]|uniref:Protein MgtC n=1 Tax=Microvirga brassicacearum TaxID=2580413 RepID=A0A5N3PEW8_9HYPH|nr:MgtC/SapB family protein [Microvirga brassicacearum]KAB0268195.1 MgtC/SapB family protein [Microvirga brassicacearum]
MKTWADLITDVHLEILLRLIAATCAGMVIGLNRDLHDKPMGMRTLGLVSLGSAVVVLAGSDLGDLTIHRDAASRIIQGVLTGLGFLGAGVILREPERLEIHGLTTAATVLIAATFGVSAGLGEWFLTFVGTVIALALLVFGKSVEHFFGRALKRPKGSSKASDEEIQRGESDRRDRAP